ncbi:MAG: restriction endonuclease subunit S [Candidatus Brocadiales bacterium]|nr:restriction endonuclease subunit S [Candidatus Brocadiales bacterium]
MNSWEKLPIGELFSLEKGLLQSTKCTPGDYTFITASSEWKTHNEYSHDCEALIYAVAASGSLGRCHHYNGKFVSSDLCFILRAKDEKKRPINYRFYQNVFRFLKDDIVAKTKAGTSKESISQKRFSAYNLPYIDIEHQSYWENKLNNLNDKIENFEVESSSQSSYLTKLRQAILQEAIEGKLTSDWREENPVREGDPDYDAEALLEKIQAEKEKLIKEGKIKKQKPLAPIKAEEVLFELPQGWVWTRLGEIAESLSTGPFGSMLHKSDYVTNGIPIVNPMNLSDYGIVADNRMMVSDSTANRLCRYKLKENDLIIARRGNLSKCGIVFKDQENWLCGTGSFFMRLMTVNIHFFVLVYRSKVSQSYLLQDSIGQTMDNLNQKLLSKLPIALPPIAEQQAIVNRVENILSMVDELEKQVFERKEQSEQLMQSVLREAFEGGNHA